MGGVELVLQGVGDQKLGLEPMSFSFHDKQDESPRNFQISFMSVCLLK